MPSSGPRTPGPARVLRLLLCGPAASGHEDFAYVIGPVFDELLRKDIRVEITVLATSELLLDALDRQEHDFVLLVFQSAVGEHTTAAAGPARTGPPQPRPPLRPAAGRLRGSDLIRLVRRRTLKPLFVAQDGALLRESGAAAVIDAGADAVLSLPFSGTEFEAGLRRFLHASAFRRSAPSWPSPLRTAPARPAAPAAPACFLGVAAIQVPAIRHTFSTCVRTIEPAAERRAWLDLAAGSAVALLEEARLAPAGLVVLQLNTLEYPEEFAELERYVWLISELRSRTAGFIITLNGHWHTPDALHECECAGADLALPVPFEIEEAFEAVRLAHAIWQSGR